jgi:hypothetical protein
MHSVFCRGHRAETQKTNKQKPAANVLVSSFRQNSCDQCCSSTVPHFNRGSIQHLLQTFQAIQDPSLHLQWLFLVQQWQVSLHDNVLRAKGPISKHSDPFRFCG